MKLKQAFTFSSPQDGVYVHGLSLDGAGWDKRGMRLVEPSAKVLFAALPVVHMFAVNELSKEQKAQRVCNVIDIMFFSQILWMIVYKRSHMC